MKEIQVGGCRISSLASLLSSRSFCYVLGRHFNRFASTRYSLSLFYQEIPLIRGKLKQRYYKVLPRYRRLSINPWIPSIRMHARTDLRLMRRKIGGDPVRSKRSIRPTECTGDPSGIRKSSGKRMRKRRAHVEVPSPCTISVPAKSDWRCIDVLQNRAENMSP